MLLDVTHVKALPNFRLLLDFENGEQRCFDMSPHMDQKPWTRLKTNNSFMGAFVENGTVAWQGNIDIDPETLYDDSVLIIEQST